MYRGIAEYVLFDLAVPGNTVCCQTGRRVQLGLPVFELFVKCKDGQEFWWCIKSTCTNYSNLCKKGFGFGR